MEEKVCSGFGHRKIWNSTNSLIAELEKLVVEENITVFMTGGMGEFDNMFISAVRILKNKYPNIKLCLVIPYFSKNMNVDKLYYEKMYDEIIIPDVVEGVHPKSAITKRNRWIVEQSDVIVTYVYQNYGGAYAAKRYADKLGKKIISVYKN